ncbi:hypothetical protein AB0C11_27810 [Streptomyces sp. NPDC039016]|uniref:hypothetical protein n=1 Tax=Streptomyces sp. NPDC039016 TaxID=3154330 RepID=UPI00340A55CA
MSAEAWAENQIEPTASGETTCEWPEPAPDQIKVISRVLAPLIRQVRAERAERRAAA